METALVVSPEMTISKRAIVTRQMYDLKPLESMDTLAENGTYEFVTRVPGGWLFTLRYLCIGEEAEEFFSEGVTFVPYDDDFYLWKQKLKVSPDRPITQTGKQINGPWQP